MWDLQARVAAFDAERFQSLGPGYLALSLAGEAGELANFVKKVWREDVRIGQADGFGAISAEQKAFIGQELADVLLLALVLCNHLGLDAETEVARKLRIIDERLRAGHYGNETNPSLAPSPLEEEG